MKVTIKSRFDSYSVKNSVLIISHITFQDCRVYKFFPTTFLSCTREIGGNLGLVARRLQNPVLVTLKKSYMWCL